MLRVEGVVEFSEPILLEFDPAVSLLEKGMILARLFLLIDAVGFEHEVTVFVGQAEAQLATVSLSALLPAREYAEQTAREAASCIWHPDTVYDVATFADTVASVDIQAFFVLRGSVLHIERSMEGRLRGVFVADLLRVITDNFLKNKLYRQVGAVSDETLASVYVQSRSFVLDERSETLSRVMSYLPDTGSIVLQDALAGNFTQASLSQAVNQLAYFIIENFRTDTPLTIAVCVEKSCLLIIARLAILQAGHAFLSLSPDESLASIEEKIKTSGTPYIFVERDMAVAVRQQVLSLEFLASLASPAVPIDASNPDALAYLMYTSGTTGKPVPYAVTNRQLSLEFKAIADAFELNAGSCVFDPFPSLFDMSIMTQAVLTVGGRLVISSQAAVKEVAIFADELMASRATHLIMVTSRFFTLLAHARVHGLSFPYLTHVLVGGEKIPNDIFCGVRDVLPHHAIKVGVGYGTTQTVGIDSISFYEPDIPLDDTFGTLIPNKRVLCVDQYGNPLPRNIKGLLAISGNVSSGPVCLVEHKLVLDTELDARFSLSIQEARWFLPQDVGVVTASGMIHCEGRSTEASAVKIGGQFVDIAALEHILEATDGVMQAVVLQVGIASHPFLVAYMTVNAAVHASIASLKQACIAQLQSCHVPYWHWPSCRVIERMPISITGKIDKSKLLEEALEPAKGSGRIYAENELERALMLILDQLCMHMNVSVCFDRPLVDYIAHFLKSEWWVSWVTRINDNFNQQFSPMDFTPYMSLAEMATEIATEIAHRSAARDGAGVTLVVHDDETYLPCAAQHVILRHCMSDPPATIKTYMLRARLVISAEYCSLERVETALRETIRKQFALREIYEPASGLMRILPYTDELASTLIVRLPADSLNGALVAFRSEYSVLDYAMPRIRFFVTKKGTSYQVFFIGFHVDLDLKSIEIIFKHVVNYLSVSSSEPESGMTPAQLYLDYVFRRRNAREHFSPVIPKELALQWKQVKPVQLPFTCLSAEQDSEVKERNLSEAEKDPVEDLAQCMRVSPAAVKLALLGVALANETGSAVFTVGVPHDTRPAQSVYNDVCAGQFVEALPIVIDIKTQLTLQDLIINIHHQLQLLRSFISQGGDVDKMIQHFQSLLPMQRSMFEVLATFVEVPDLCGISFAQAEPFYSSHPPFPLNIYFFARDFKIQGLNVASDLLTRVADAYVRLVCSMMEADAYQDELYLRTQLSRYYDFYVLAPGVKDEIIRFNAREEALKKEMPSFISFFIAQAKLHADEQCVITEEKIYTYAEIAALAKRYAYYFSAVLGLKKGDFLLVSLTGTVHDIVVSLALAWLHITKVPFEMDYMSTAEIDYYVQATGAKFILLSDNPPPVWREITNVGFASILSASTVMMSDVVGGSEDLEVPMIADEHFNVYVRFSSGTTGLPKGALISEVAVVRFLQEIITLGCHAERVLTVVRSRFDIQEMDFMRSVFTGGVLAIPFLPTVQNAEALIAFARRYEMTSLQATPTQLNSFMHSLTNPSILASLIIYVGGEPVPKILVRRFLDLGYKVFHCYGPLQATIWTHVGLVTPDILDLSNDYAFMPIFEPLKCTFSFVYQDQLCCAGPTIYTPLTSEQDASDIKNVEDINVLFTGDRACYLSPGCIQLLGRATQHIKLKGFWFNYQEFQGVLLRQSSVCASYVDKFEGVVLALVVLDPGCDISALYLDLLTRLRLPLMLLASIAFKKVNCFFTNASGKVDIQATVAAFLPTFNEAATDLTIEADFLSTLLIKVRDFLIHKEKQVYLKLLSEDFVLTTLPDSLLLFELLAHLNATFLVPAGFPILTPNTVLPAADSMRTLAVIAHELFDQKYSTTAASAPRFS